ncbi:MAG TPA: BLUF domain-containing protein [Microvirga sp.]|jgi:hypothetical protein
MSIHRLIYVSRPDLSRLKPNFDVGLARILAASRANNQLNGISGTLLASHRCFVQVLEGPRDALLSTSTRIFRDPRHTDVTVYEEAFAPHRYFGEWSMHFGQLDAVDPSFIDHLLPDGLLDPFALSAEQLLSLAFAVAECPRPSLPLLRIDRLGAAVAGSTA